MHSPKKKEEVHEADEFGGPMGNLFIMVFSHFVIYYIWQ